MNGLDLVVSFAMFLTCLWAWARYFKNQTETRKGGNDA